MGDIEKGSRTLWLKNFRAKEIQENRTKVCREWVTSKWFRNSRAQVIQDNVTKVEKG